MGHDPSINANKAKACTAVHCVAMHLSPVFSLFQLQSGSLDQECTKSSKPFLIPPFHPDQFWSNQNQSMATHGSIISVCKDESYGVVTGMGDSVSVWQKGQLLYTERTYCFVSIDITVWALLWDVQREASRLCAKIPKILFWEATKISHLTPEKSKIWETTSGNAPGALLCMAIREDEWPSQNWCSDVIRCLCTILCCKLHINCYKNSWSSLISLMEEGGLEIITLLQWNPCKPALGSCFFLSYGMSQVSFVTSDISGAGSWATAWHSQDRRLAVWSAPPALSVKASVLRLEFPRWRQAWVSTS